MTFVDSSFWIARFMPRDSRHGDATRVSEQLQAGRLVTSNLVLGETWTFLRKRVGHRFAMSWLDAVLGRVTVQLERIDSGLEDQAWRWLRAHDERPYSFVDATSFALMRKLRIEEALAFDGDFAAAGFVELRS
ncbi:MAG: type II toxin-antitoxin system VapC family toxin [Gaiellaceae bacterium]